MIEDILRILQNTGRKIVLLPQNADLDATGSAAALALNFKNITVGVLGKMKKISKDLLSMVRLSYLHEPDLHEYEYTIVVDTAHPNMFGNYSEFFNTVKTIVIDHHARTEDWNCATYYYCDETTTSCAEILYDFLKKCNIKICKRTGSALLTAIFADSGQFRYATNATLKNFCAILEDAELDLKSIYKFQLPSEDISKRIAQLKGAQRLRYEKVNDWLVCISKVGAFEALVAKAFVQLGADVAFVGSQHKSEFRISARASDAIVAANFHLGRFCISLCNELNCHGGGHTGAAGFRGAGNVDAILNKCLEKVRTELRSLTVQFY